MNRRRNNNELIQTSMISRHEFKLYILLTIDALYNNILILLRKSDLKLVYSLISQLRETVVIQFSLSKILHRKSLITSVK